MNKHQKVIQLEDFQKRSLTPEEVKRILTADECDFEDKFDSDEEILTTKVFQNTPFYVRLLALLFLVIYIVGFVTIFLGWCIFENKSHWVIGIVLSLLVMSRWKSVVNFGKRHQQAYALAITKKWIFCAIFSRYDGKSLTTHQFVKEQPVFSLWNLKKLYTAYEDAEKEVENRNIERQIDGADTSHTSRYATIVESKHYIALRDDDENEIVIPYNNRALEFLKTVALLNN